HQLHIHAAETASGARRDAGASGARGGRLTMATGLENKPWYVAAIAGVVFGGIVAGLLYWQVSTKQQDQIRAQDNRIQELERKITEGRAAEQKLPQFREEVRRLELELDKLLRILPARR